jgi:hypothetical protein
MTSGSPPLNATLYAGYRALIPPLHEGWRKIATFDGQPEFPFCMGPEKALTLINESTGNPKKEHPA